MPGDGSGRLTDPAHAAWLQAETDRLLAFYERSVVDPDGGFHWLDAGGSPRPQQPKQLWITARMVHCFALAELLGRPGAGTIVEHGLAFLAGPLHDARHGGWYSSDADDRKQAYGHAFVLLAGSSAAQAGHAGGQRLAEAALEVLEHRFYEPERGLYAESFSADWAESEPYRGANSHMHLTEALMAAAEATGEDGLHERAAAIAERIVARFAADNDWRVLEHFDAAWRPLPDYNRERPRDPFRPYGSTVGHWLEWARLLLQLQSFDPEGREWMRDAAVTLFRMAVEEGWDGERGGFVLTVDWDGRPFDRDRYHWVVAEAIGAAVYLHRHTGDPAYERWYSVFWDYAQRRLIDHERGGWHHQLDPDHRVIATVWDGKPDLYHALQATLFARVPPDAGIAAALRDNRVTV